jgi:hypothetical protein
MAALEELGWLQFERLCELVLQADAGVDPLRWEGRAYTGREFVGEEPLLGLAAPVRVRCVWGTSPQPCDVLFINAPAAEDLAKVVYGEDELLEAIRRIPEIRFKLPSVLSLGALEPDGAALAGSTLDVDATEQLARVFVPTPSWHQAVATLRAHHFLVLTGPPEMGKTAIARMLGRALLTQGWEVHECWRPEQVWARLDRERPQLFIADDAFGSTEYRPDAADRWASELDRILRATDDKHWLVWTSRPAPLRAGLRRLHRERGAERFPQPGAVQVDASALGPEEKTLILYRHARAAGLPAERREFIKLHGRQIVEHEHFTPERIRRFVGRGAPPDAVERELSEPTEAMAASFGALEREHVELLMAMLDSPPGPVHERELAAALRRHAGGLPKAPADLVDRLTDHFLRVLA